VAQQILNVLRGTTTRRPRSAAAQQAAEKSDVSDVEDEDWLLQTSP
jgi:hypothetical protein